MRAQSGQAVAWRRAGLAVVSGALSCSGEGAGLTGSPGRGRLRLGRSKCLPKTGLDESPRPGSAVGLLCASRGKSCHPVVPDSGFFHQTGSSYLLSSLTELLRSSDVTRANSRNK